MISGLIKALGKIDKIIKIMKSSSDTAEAKNALMKLPEKFSLEQVEAIMSLTLRRLTALEEKKLTEEHVELNTKIAYLQNLLINDSQVFGIMKNESLQLKEKFGVKRKTQIIAEEVKISNENLIPNERYKIPLFFFPINFMLICNSFLSNTGR
jgi:DNA gyrase subunit A